MQLEGLKVNWHLLGKIVLSAAQKRQSDARPDLTCTLIARDLQLMQQDHIWFEVLLLNGFLMTSISLQDDLLRYFFRTSITDPKSAFTCTGGFANLQAMSGISLEW